MTKDWDKANILPLYKRKKEPEQHMISRSVVLLSAAGKCLANIYSSDKVSKTIVE